MKKKIKTTTGKPSSSADNKKKPVKKKDSEAAGKSSAKKLKSAAAKKSSATTKPEKNKTDVTLPESLTQNLIDNNYALIYAFDLDGKFIFANKKLETLLNFPKEKLIGNARELFIPKKTAAQHKKNDRIVRKTKKPVTFEEQNQEPDGTHYYLTEKFPIFDSKGKVSAIGCFSVDITERKKSEQALRENELYNRLLFNTSPIGLVLCRMDGSFVDVNPAFAKLIGRTVEEILKLTYWDITPKKFELKERAQLRSLDTTGTYGPYEKEYLHKDGRLVPVRLQGLVLEKNNERFIWSSVENISERKLTKKQLTETEERYRLIADNTADSIAVFDMNLKYVYISPSVKTLLGYTPDELSALGIKNILPPDSWQLVQKVFIEEMELELSGKAEPERSRVIETEQYRKDGTLICVEGTVSFIRNEEGKPINILAISRDISERKLAEKALLESHGKYQAIFESTGTATMIVDEDTSIVMANQECLAITGYSSSEIIGQRWTQFVAPESLQIMLRNRDLRKKDPLLAPKKYEVNLVNKKGEVRRSLLDIGIIPGTKQSVVSILDVTELKKAEEEAVLANKKWQTTFDGMKDSVFLLDLNGIILQANKASASLLGKTVDEIVGKHCYEIVHNTTCPIEGCPYVRMEFSKQRETMILTIGDSWYEVTVDPLFDDNGGLKGAVHIISDITERKRADEELQKSRSELHEYFENDISADYVVSVEGEIFSCNKTFLDLFGFEKKSHTDNFNIIGLYKNPDDRKELIKRVKANGKVENYEVDFVNRDGETINAIINAIGKFDDSGKLIQTRGYVVDITDRKKAEFELQKSESKLRAIFSSMVDVIFSMDIEGRYLEIAPSNPDLLYRPSSELEGKTLHEVFPKEQADFFLSKVKQCIETQQLVNMDYTLEIGNKTIWFTANLSPLSLTSALLVARDITERKLAEEALKLSEEKFNKAFHSSAAAMSIQDSDDLFVDVNNAFLELTGYSRDELIGHRGNELPLWENEEEAVNINKQFRSEGNLRNIEFRFRKKSGEIGVGILSAEAIILDGKPADLTVVLDITDRKKAADELILFTTLLDQSNDAIEVLDPETGRYLDVNERGRLDLGYSREEFLTLSVYDVDPIIDYAGFKNIVEELKISNSKIWESIHRRKNGTTFPVEVNIKIVRLDRDYIVSVVRDITERKTAEENLLKFSRAVAQSPAAIIITDTNGVIEYVNPKSLEITGYKPEEVIGQNPRIFSSGETPKNEYESLWATISSGKEWRGELHNKKKNGELYWEFASISPVINESGIITHYLAVKEDITENKKMIDELVVAKEQAEKSDNLKSEFLAQISHEIRTPINIMLGNVDFLKDILTEHIDADAKKCFNSIAVASKRIIRTIDLILNMSEVQTSSYKPDFIKINLDKEVLRKLTQEHHLLAKQRGLKLTYHCEIVEPNILGDEYSVTQIFANLIDNAIKYTETGGIGIRLTNNKKGDIVVEIKDTGIGMSKEFLVNIFKPFVQEEQGYSRSYDGNGLGLALVKSYCDINNAVIKVESKKNVGTSFRVIFSR